MEKQRIVRVDRDGNIFTRRAPLHHKVSEKTAKHEVARLNKEIDVLQAKKREVRSNTK